jgi:hypothetical protein
MPKNNQPDVQQICVRLLFPNAGRGNKPGRRDEAGCESLGRKIEICAEK